MTRLILCGVRLIEEDKQRQLAEMKGTLWGMFSGEQAAKAAEAQAKAAQGGQ